jgi:hypothetical protein
MRKVWHLGHTRAATRTANGARSAGSGRYGTGSVLFRSFLIKSRGAARNSRRVHAPAAVEVHRVPSAVRLPALVLSWPWPWNWSWSWSSCCSCSGSGSGLGLGSGPGEEGAAGTVRETGAMRTPVRRRPPRRPFRRASHPAVRRTVPSVAACSVAPRGPVRTAVVLLLIAAVASCSSGHRRRAIGFGFAVVEECARYDECGEFASAYDRRVFDI